ncbi:hypothetical protein Tco_1195650 [Tanacetum coccineum]
MLFHLHLLAYLHPPTIDLSDSGLKEFQQPEFEGYGIKENKGVCENTSNEIKQTTDAPIIEDWVFDCDKDEYGVRILKSDNVQPKPKRNFVPTAVLTKFGIVPVSVARPINTTAPKSFVNAAKTRSNAFQKVTSAVEKQGINVVKSLACWVWRPKINVLDHVSKNSGSYNSKQFDYVDPTGRHKFKT